MMVITGKRRVYQYYDVPEHVYKGLMTEIESDTSKG